MAETTTTATPPLKRHREEDKDPETLIEEETKRHKPSSSSSSYNQIICLLEDPDEQDDKQDHDLTPLIATLQQEISYDDVEGEQNAVVSSDDINDGNALDKKPKLSTSSSSSSSSSSSFWTSCSSKEDEGKGDKERVIMRHLLEASDDELGIPSTDFGGSDYGLINDFNYDYANGGGGDLLDGFGDALWEFEDEAANYYTLLQSELFM